ncbi:MAG: DUF4878 domain-containing protein [archaeon]
MKINYLLFTAISLLIVCCGCVQESPEHAIERLEREVYESGNMENYVRNSYCNSSCKSKMENASGLSYNETVIYMNLMFAANEAEKQIESFEITNSEEYDSNNVKVYYSIYYKNAEQRDDFAYMTKKDGKWLIDIDRELFG